MAGVQFKHLAHAVSPAIYGHELLKAGLLLALLGGVRKVSPLTLTLDPDPDPYSNLTLNRNRSPHLDRDPNPDLNPNPNSNPAYPQS